MRVLDAFKMATSLDRRSVSLNSARILLKLAPLILLSFLIKILWDFDLLTKGTVSPRDKLVNEIKTFRDLTGSLRRTVSGPLKEDPQHQRVLADLVTKCSNLTTIDDGFYGDSPLPWCPCVPSNLDGEQPLPHPALTMKDVIAAHPEVTSGSWRPVTCLARQRLCVLVTYRNRSEQVAPFLEYIHERLQRQGREYSIYIIEQSDGSPFNRGLLFNVGFLHAEANSSRHCDCVILHDIDMFAEDDRNLYMCPQGAALHMAPYRQHLNYSLSYVGYFGGITAVGADLYRAANGYSNLYFGWGSEDDELLHRLFAVGAKLMRHRPEISKVTMVSHLIAPENEDRLKLYYTWKSRWKTDGLNNVQALVDSTHMINMPLATWLYVNITAEGVRKRSKA